MLKSYNAEDVFIYADCPYLGMEDYYENVFSMEDHKDLADMLKFHIFTAINYSSYSYRFRNWCGTAGFAGCGSFSKELYWCTFRNWMCFFVMFLLTFYG